jgi:Bacterial protein of unknown function (DUF898)
MDGTQLTPVIGKCSYEYQDNKLFSLSVKTGLLTLLTVGIYRFWAKTRIRQYFWNSVRVDGDGFEYTGTGLEKLLGFLIAVVILVIYLAVVQLILFQFGLIFVFDPKTKAELLMQLGVIYLSFFSMTPLILFAKYRSRRYKLARTRFRGIRFGMVGAAGGYVWRGLLYLILTIASLGILWPLMTFRLEKYMADRSWYGDTPFVQNGKWTGLYPAMKHLLIALAILVVGIGIVIALHKPRMIPVIVGVGYLWGACGYVHYRVQGFAYLTDHKILGADISFTTAPRTGTVLKKILLGWLLLGLFAVVVGGVFFFTVGKVMILMGSPVATAIGGGIAYLVFLVFVSALSLIFITEPIILHMVSETQVINMQAFADVKQRVTDTGADAEGFADALDWGGAI